MMRLWRWLAMIAGVAILAVCLAAGDDFPRFAEVGGPWLGAALIVLGLAPAVRVSTQQRSTIALGAFVSVTVIVLASRLARMQVIRQGAYAEKTGEDPVDGEVLSNPRMVDDDLVTLRGAILDRNNQALATSAFIEGSMDRGYPEPGLAHFAGYFSPLLYGKTELESHYDDQLSGRAFAGIHDWFDREVLDRPAIGQNLVLTIDSGLQRQAVEALAGRSGAIVLVEAATGAVLTLASSPGYDPSRLVATMPEQVEPAREYWQEIIDDPVAPLVLRATMGLYPPGSTFKVVTAAAAIDAGLAMPGTIYADSGFLEVDGRIIIEQNRPDESVDEWTLAEGVAYSLNVVLAQVGLALGGKKLWDYATAFGVGMPIEFDVPVAETQISSSEDFLKSDAALADTAFGQGELLVTPLQMALVAATIANNGVMMQPFLVQEIVSPDGDTLEQRARVPLSNPVSAETASLVREMMIGAVQFGSAGAAATPGLVVGGKTGTAEVEGAEPHSWFIGFAGEDEDAVAVAVVLEHGGMGTGEAAAIGGQLLAAGYFGGD